MTDTSTGTGLPDVAAEAVIERLARQVADLSVRLALAEAQREALAQAGGDQ